MTASERASNFKRTIDNLMDERRRLSPLERRELAETFQGTSERQAGLGSLLTDQAAEMQAIAAQLMLDPD